MRVICAWHFTYFGYELEMQEKEPLNDRRISHSMCDACRDILLARKKREGKMEKAWTQRHWYHKALSAVCLVTIGVFITIFLIDVVEFLSGWQIIHGGIR